MVGPVFEHTFVSNAQNGEDIRLMRAFHDRGPGFYVEIGGSDPKIDSISRAFYDRGWHGIIVEPLPHQAAAFREQRPRDVVFEAVCASRGGTVTFFSVDVEGSGTGLSTMDEATATKHADVGRVVSEQTVRALTCSQILEGVRDVDFMVIDVEGLEEDVIRSLLDTDVRPCVLVVEAIDPLTHEPAHRSWEPLLLAAGYLFSAFDGINRFYVADRLPELVDVLAIPPNITDNYIRVTDMENAIVLAEQRAQEASRLEKAELVAELLSEEARVLRETRSEIFERERALSRDNRRLRRQLRRIRQSRSYRAVRKASAATEPLRKLLKG